MDSRTTAVPLILLDTNIVSGLAKGDLPAQEARAVVEIVGMMTRSDVTLAGTTVMRDELNGIPEPARAAHDAVYRTLRILKTNSGVTWLDPNTGAIQQNPVYQRLCDVLPNEADARMIAIGVEHNQEYLMTHDQRTIISRRSAVEAACPIKPRLPTEILGELLKRST